MTEAKRSAFAGQHCTHVNARADAVIHQGREYVPTVYGEATGNTKWVDSIEELRKVGGKICWNEDQTEVWLCLPEGHKFSIGLFRE